MLALRGIPAPGKFSLKMVVDNSQIAMIVNMCNLFRKFLMLQMRALPKSSHIGTIFMPGRLPTVSRQDPATCNQVFLNRM
jgi:hypothetical protein